MNWYIAKGIRVTEKALLERYPSGIPPFVDEVILRADHDAALRRAKADGIRMVEVYARACVHERAVQLDGFQGSSGMAGVIRGKQSEADRIVDWAYACAAQIEEGE